MNMSEINSNPLAAQNFQTIMQGIDEMKEIHQRNEEQRKEDPSLQTQ